MNLNDLFDLTQAPSSTQLMGKVDRKGHIICMSIEHKTCIGSEKYLVFKKEKV